MKFKSILPAALIAAFSASAAMAAPLTKTGEIKSTDATKHELVLATGDTFVVGAKVNLAKLKAGEKVTVTYETKDGKNEASKVAPAK